MEHVFLSSDYNDLTSMEHGFHDPCGDNQYSDGHLIPDGYTSGQHASMNEDQTLFMWKHG